MWINKIIDYCSHKRKTYCSIMREKILLGEISSVYLAIIPFYCIIVMFKIILLACNRHTKNKFCYKAKQLLTSVMIILKAIINKSDVFSFHLFLESLSVIGVQYLFITPVFYLFNKQSYIICASYTDDRMSQNKLSFVVNCIEVVLFIFAYFDLFFINVYPAYNFRL